MTIEDLNKKRNTRIMIEMDQTDLDNINIDVALSKETTTFDLMNAANELLNMLTEVSNTSKEKILDAMKTFDQKKQKESQ